MTQAYIPASLRRLVYERAHGRCEYCLIAPLYHPRRDRWAEHFQLVGARIVPLTPAGRATVRLLQLNRPERVAERELLIAAGVYPLPT